MFWSVLGRGGGPRGVQPKNEMTRLMARQSMNNGEKSSKIYFIEDKSKIK